MRDISDFTFDGPFAEVIPAYVQHKRICGYKVPESELYRLRQIDRFFKDAGVTGPAINREMYELWAKKQEGERPRTTAGKRTVLSSLGKYLLSIGYEDIYTGEKGERSFESDYIPHIFTKEEIQRMFDILDDRCLESHSYENEAFRMMISMYYCCGFRKSEVVQLRLGDVDFAKGKVTVLNGKNDVSRIVIVSDSLHCRLCDYRDCHHQGSGRDDYLFPGIRDKGKPFSKHTLYKMYHELLREAGVPDRTDGRIHRLHDMRHTFCIYALERMQEKGYDLYTSLPLLSTYLGHKHVTETEYYLRLVESRHDAVLGKVRTYSPGLFPEIGGDGNG